MKSAVRLLLSVGPFLILPALTWAQPPDRPEPAAHGPDGRWDKGDQGGIEFRMEKKPWSEVFDWLSRRTGMPVITTFKLTGSFTFVGPPGARYTAPEIFEGER